MEFIADFHIHSHYSRATSRDCNTENLYKWAKIKGISLLGTGDFTHPLWFSELKEKLEEKEEGFYELKDEFKKRVEEEIPLSCKENIVRFVISGEISSIYKKNDKTRKIHNLILLPNFEVAKNITNKLEKIGNINYDGRPILGLDSKNLLEIVLEASPLSLFIPAHVWTPHFSLFGANSGFDKIEECFEDLTPYIYALETGLSSDPPMNWRLSSLDRFLLVSNSDAHSPSNLAREANIFDTQLSYHSIFNTLKNKDRNSFIGTLEFYPEEGKYHYDGHRSCNISFEPYQTIKNNYLCPKCKKKLTVGVLHRVELLADRSYGFKPLSASKYESIIPLKEIIADQLEVSVSSKNVENNYQKLITSLGSELNIIRNIPIEEIKKVGTELIAEGIKRIREGKVKIIPGYDGVYGKIKIFNEEDRKKGELQLFPQNNKIIIEEKTERYDLEKPISLNKKEIQIETPSQDQLNEHQKEAIKIKDKPVVVLAGPGSGKTKTLTFKILSLLLHENVPPENITALTFTNKAAEEIKDRIETILGKNFPKFNLLKIGTFHSIFWEILKEIKGENITIFDTIDSYNLIESIIDNKRKSKKVYEEISKFKCYGIFPHDKQVKEDIKPIYEEYQKSLKRYNAFDYDDILFEALQIFKNDKKLLKDYSNRFKYLLVDEFQDVNKVQYELIKLFAGDGKNLFVIGDIDQAIYGFRGADFNYFMKIKEDFKETNIVKLVTNYRSSPTIIQGALSLIKNNKKRINVELVPYKKEGIPYIRVIKNSSELSEGIFVVKEINKLVGGISMINSDGEEKRSFSDIAVLFRTTKQAEILEECFLKEGIPYKVVGQKSFLDSKHVREFLAFFRYLINPTDIFRFNIYLKDSKLLSSENIKKYKELIKVKNPSEIISNWLDDNNLQNDKDLNKLLFISSHFEDIKIFLERLPFYLEQDYEYIGKDSLVKYETVSLMTLHASKGLEFPIVFIIGCEDGLIPMKEFDSDLEEERRLFYVGMTRAKEELILLWSETRIRYEIKINNKISPFIEEIPQEILTYIDKKKKRGRINTKERQLELFD